MKLGVVGTGYVGAAVCHGFKQYVVGTYDLDKLSTHDSIEELCGHGEIIFVCVPTPMKPDGSCDISIVEEVISEIHAAKMNNLAVIKSTVTPGTTELLASKYPDIGIVFSPEFLTEANHLRDFKNSSRVILGGPARLTQKVVDLFNSIYPNKKYVQTDSKTAETVKYFANTFLATKVSFANEMNQVCDKLGVNYRQVLSMVLLDSRIGKTHFAVPGTDGLHGFGGKCFPKDLNCFKSFALELGVGPTIMEAVWQKNLEVREDKDWLRINGVIAKENSNE